MVKICPICRMQLANKAALAAHMASVHPGRAVVARPRRARAGLNINRLASTEYLGDFGDASTFEIFPGKSGCSRLDTFAGVYELFRIIRWVVRFRSIVSPTTSGHYVAGTAYEKDHRPDTLTAAAACQPTVQQPIYRSSTMSVPTALVMGQPWLPTSARSGEGSTSPGAVVLFISGSPPDTKLSVWVDYVVEFQGPTAISRVRSDTVIRYNASTRTTTDDRGNKIDVLHFESPAHIDVELATQDTSYINKFVQYLKGIGTDVQELHRTVGENLTYLHLIARGISGAVSAWGQVAPWILHVAPRPFRPAPAVEWHRLGRDRAPPAGEC